MQSIFVKGVKYDKSDSTKENVSTQNNMKLALIYTKPSLVKSTPDLNIEIPNIDEQKIMKKHQNSKDKQ